MDIVQSFNNYLQHEKRYSEHTVTAYLRDIHQFKVYCSEQLPSQPDDVDLAVVTFMQVRQWMVHLMTEGLTAKTVNRKLSSLRTFFHFLKKRGIRKDNPTAKIIAPKAGKRLPMYLREDEMDNLFERIEFAPDWKGQRDKLLLSLLYECGLRRSELIDLELRNVNLSKGLIKVFGKGSKERILPLSKKLCQDIEKYLEVRKAELDIETDIETLLVTDSGKKMYPKFVYNKVVRYLTQVTSLEKKSPHVLRHTFATHLTGRGAEIKAVKDLLGHASLAATQVYTHNDIEKLKKAYKGAHPRS